MADDSMISRRGRVVFVSGDGVAAFNRRWPCSPIQPHEQFFEFEANGDLVFTSLQEDEDGSAAVAMSEDCRAFLTSGDVPEWAR